MRAKKTTSKRKRPSRAKINCDCPNCKEIERQGLDVPAADRWHICGFPGCEKGYKRPSHLKAHKRWHSGEKRFTCAICNDKFQRSDHLGDHVRQVHGVASAAATTGAGL